MQRRFCVRIEDMTCPRCEARVAAALRALPGVRRVRVSWRRGLAVVWTDEGIGPWQLVEAVEQAARGTWHRYAVSGIYGALR